LKGLEEWDWKNKIEGIDRIEKIGRRRLIGLKRLEEKDLRDWENDWKN
jgi:hypothetical protein